MANAASVPWVIAERKFAFCEADFERVRQMIHARAGIALGVHKREMVYSRLARRLRILGYQDFGRYLDLLESQPTSTEWEYFVNALTTNLTAFFREPHHFPILASFVRQRSEPLSVWCCGASTGEEAYSIAITLVEALGPRANMAKVFATDIDTYALSLARMAVYAYERVAGLEPYRLKRFFYEVVVIIADK